jgi:hypothetical protein
MASVASSFAVSTDALMSLNKNKGSKPLQKGMKIKLPGW